MIAVVYTSITDDDNEIFPFWYTYVGRYVSTSVGIISSYQQNDYNMENILYIICIRVVNENSAERTHSNKHLRLYCLEAFYVTMVSYKYIYIYIN